MEASQEWAPSWLVTSNGGHCRFDVRVERLQRIFGPPCRIIVEVDGMQHFVEHWLADRESLDVLRRRDLWKMEQALSHGFSVIRLRAKWVRHATSWKAWLQRVLKSCASAPPCIVLEMHELYHGMRSAFPPSLRDVTKVM